MKLRISSACVVLALSFSILPVVQASSVRSLGVEEVVEQSEVIFEGRVIGYEVLAGDSDRRVFTRVRFEVLDVLKGAVEGDQLEISYLGGTLGNQMMKVTHSHIPALGEQGVYFAKPLNRQYVQPLQGWDQGHYLIKTGDAYPVVTTRGGQVVYQVNRQSAEMVESGLSTGVRAV